VAEVGEKEGFEVCKYWTDGAEMLRVEAVALAREDVAPPEAMASFCKVLVKTPVSTLLVSEAVNVV